MKYGLFILMLYCLTQASVADPKPNPGIFSDIKNFFAGSSSSPYTDAAKDLISVMKNNVSKIFAEMYDDIKANKENFLTPLSNLFNKDFSNVTQCGSNSTYNICNNNQTSSLIQSGISSLQSISKLSIFCLKVNLLSSVVHKATDDICKDAPDLQYVYAKAQNMSETYVNNTLRSWFCTYSRIFDNQIAQSKDFTGLSQLLLDPKIKTQIMGYTADINRCMFKFILDVNTTQTSNENCQSPINDFIGKITKYLGNSSYSSQDIDILNALMCHSNQMLSSINSINDAHDTYINDTRNTTAMASNSFSTILLNQFDSIVSPIQRLDFLQSKNSTLNSIATSIGECFKCTINIYIDYIRMKLDWAGLILDTKRAIDCKAVTFMDKIQNYTCKTYNSSCLIVNAASANLSQQADQHQNNLDCFENEFNSSFITMVLSTILNLFKSTIGLITNSISYVVNVINDIKGKTTTDCAAKLTNVLNKFNGTCTNGTNLIQPLFDQLIKDLNTCKVEQNVVTDFCGKGYFGLSLWNIKTNIQYFSGIFNGISQQLLQLGTTFQECIDTKCKEAVPKLELALSTC